MIITFACYPILIVIGSIFLSYRFIIDKILEVKTGTKYGGLLAPQDAFFFREEKSKGYEAIVFIIKSKIKRDILKESRQLLQKKVFETPFYPKLTGTVGKFGGYLYLNKNTCILDECLKELEVPENVTFDENYLKVLLADHVNKPLPQNDTTLWEFLSSRKPLSRNGFSDGYYYYPLITRFHHGVGDGTSLTAFILNLFSQEETEVYGEKIYKTFSNKTYESMSFTKTFVILLKQVKEASKDIIYLYFMGIERLVQNYLQPKDNSALHGPVLTGEKFVAWTAEDSVKLVPLVKEIKNRLDAKFSSVLITALSASLTNFFRRDGYYYYPLITRFHHGVGDGTSLTAFILNLFSQEETEVYGEKIYKTFSNKTYESMSFTKTFVILLKQVKEASKDIIYLYFMGIERLVQNYLQPKDNSALHGPVLTGEKFVAWTAEDSVKLVPLVKEIKNRLDAKFSSVLITALSASLTNFFRRNSYPVPKSMSAILARILEFPKLHTSEPLPLRNKVAGVCVNNLATHSSSSLIETFGKISGTYNDIKNVDFKLNEIVFKYSAILPLHVFNKVITYNNQTFTLTNNPGCPQLKLLDGCLVEKIIAVAQNLGEVGLTFTILTYDNRFQLGLLIDKALIQSQKEAQTIVDDIFYYITMLDEETRELEESNLN